MQHDVDLPYDSRVQSCAPLLEIEMDKKVYLSVYDKKAVVAYSMVKYKICQW